MAHPQQTGTKQLAREQRRVRLAAELRSNLRKRKEQARSRTLQGAPGLNDGPNNKSDNEDDQPDAREAATTDKRGPTGEVARRAP